MKKNLAKKWVRKATCLAGAASLAMSMVVAAPSGLAAVAQAAQGDTVSIGSSTDLANFRDAVNAGSSYEGKTVQLSRDLALAGAWEPIGTAAHPFQGVFDGNGHEVAGLTVSGTSNLGLFGYVGVGGKIENLNITNGDNGSDPSTVTAQSGAQVVRNVGSIAGYVYGTPGQSAIENCSSAASVTVSSALKAADASSGQFTPEGAAAEDTTGSLAAGSTDGGITIENIGGVVGYSAAGLSDVSYSGALSATTHELPMSGNAVYVGSTVGGVAGQVGGYTATREIDSAERALTIVHYPQADGSYAQTTSVPQSVSGCANSGTLEVVADGDGGEDRFGVAVSAAFCNVGGIVGNSLASVQNCENTGDIVAKTSAATGGIVGTLRGSTYTGSSTVLNDGGEQFSFEKNGSSYSYTKTSEGPELAISRCTNRSSVTGLAQVGGILGEGGTHTCVQYSKNVSNGNAKQAITGTRWNKPMPGGIVGMTHGDISHCYNRVDVITATGAGFYASGIAGTTYRYTVSAGNAGDSPLPEVESCYSTGTVEASESTYKQAGIVGENNGTIHDCYMLEDSVLNAAQASALEPYRPMVAENNGSVADSVGVKTAVEMQGKEFCGLLNAPTTIEEYRADASFLPDIADEDAALNDGYPVFAFDRTAVETDADRAAKDQLNNSGLSAEGTGTAAYQADGNPIPALAVSYEGNALVQGADYFVIPDGGVVNDSGGCKDITEIGSTDFAAHIVGIGDYYTEDTEHGSLFTAPYRVGKGQFSTCTVAIAAHTFDFEPQFPESSEITISDAAGNVVPSSEYSVPDDPGDWVGYHVTYASKSHDGKAHAGYEMLFTAKESSNYEGSVYGYFQISKADLFRNEKTKFAGFEFGGETWSWAGSRIVNAKTVGGYLYQTDADGNEVQGMQIAYTGEAVKPQALAIQYQGGDGTWHTLTADSDYRVIYGDPGRDDLISVDVDSNTDVGSGSGAVGTRPCVTVRYVPGDTHNFMNYQNFFFDIVAADVSDPAQVTVSATGTTASSVVVKGRTGATISADNYSVSSASAGGKVTFTITGKKNLKGTTTLTVDASAQTSTGTGATSTGATQATKGGVTYQVSGGAATASKVKASAKSVTIPATVKIGGRSYKVTSIAAKAYRNAKKLKKLTIGKNVTKIGKQAFQGCKKLKTITIKSTRLGKKSIGSKAFKGIAAKAKVKVPKKKLKVYKMYLKKAGLPKTATVKS